MTDRPIIFSAPMIRALLDGRKTQTRRILKPQPDPPPGFDGRIGFSIFSGQRQYEMRGWTEADGPIMRHRPLLWAPRDRLWVRERATARPMENFLTGEPTNAIVAAYCADDEDICEKAGFNLAPWWKNYERKDLSPLAMPRWASRLTLIVEGVKVERLQEISEADARAEGMIFTDFGVYQPQGEVSIDGGRSFHALKPRQHPGWHSGQTTDPADCLHSARSAFGNLWNTLHGPDAWDANPWVAAITFKVVKANIDALANSPICEEVA